MNAPQSIKPKGNANANVESARTINAFSKSMMIVFTI